MRRQLSSCLLCATLLAACGSRSTTITPPDENEEISIDYRMSDQPYVDRALAIYSGNGRISRDQVLREVSPVVVELPTMICVGLNLRPGNVGGDTTICYSRKNGDQVLHYVNGE
ncbi:MAG: hypothetical protein K2X59_10625 [Sphingomonas sp.]|nr:hypothetical protein [Sphingomonas sp.]